jgi:hypothetical protein
VLTALISACRACSPICIGYPQSLRVIQEKSRKSSIFIDSGVKPLKSLTKKTIQKVINNLPKIHQKPAKMAGNCTVSVAQTNL